MLTSSPFIPSPSGTLTFGALLRHLRRRHGLTQAQLGERVGLSGAHISHLEKNQRLPTLTMITGDFIEALALQEEPHLATRLIELAARARGEQPPLLQSIVQPFAHEAKSSAAHYLPHPPNPLIGRDSELTRASERLLEHSGRLLTLIGPPGVGKTRLALAIAARLAVTFANGVYFIPLAHIRDTGQIASAVLAGMGVEPTERPATTLVIERLRRKETLLVLDNFEQLTTAAPMVADWLAACPHLRIVVTSRAPLRLRAEQRLQVQPLTPAAAVELFLQRAQWVAPDFPHLSTHHAAIEALCQRLDYLPLAIELMAARMDTCPAQALTARMELGATLDLLAYGGYDLPPRHRTLRRAIEYSYELLSDEERRLFRWLSAFEGYFDVEQLEALGADAMVFQRLLQKSLIHRELDEEGNWSYRLLETLREYAREQAVLMGEPTSSLMVLTSMPTHQPCTP